MKKYKVINISEQDYGCEERPEDMPYCVDVTLEDCEDKSNKVISVPDAYLYDNDIDEGSIVSIDNQFNLIKLIY